MSDPLSHGGGDGDAFDVVIPSLPGHGSTHVLHDSVFTSDVVAGLWHRLMTEGPGYEGYATSGEDVGTTVSDWIGRVVPRGGDRAVRHTRSVSPGGAGRGLEPAEKEFRTWLDEKWQDSSGYSAIQSTRPDTLAAG